MFSLGELKYSKKITSIVLGILSILIMIITTYFYAFHNYTTLSLFGIVIWIIIILCLKLMFKDSLMKWLFNAITTFNVFFLVLVISYVLSRPLPYPMYANTIIRIIMYLVFIIIFRKFVYPLYRQVVNRWQQFLLVSLGILVIYAYILLSSGDILGSISENIALILLFSLLVFFVYFTMFWSLGSIIREYEFLRDKEQTKLHESLIYSELLAYEEFVNISKQHRHDLRHHNHIIMEYLKNSDIKSAEEYLKLYDTSLMESTIKDSCENQIANAVLRMYAEKAKLEKVSFTINAEIPKNIIILQPELGSMLSNILENALEASRKVRSGEGFIEFLAETLDNTLKIELKNSVRDQVEIIDNIPISTKKDGGIGMKSVIHIVEKYNGMIHFKQEDHTFITQIIIPI